MLNVQLMKVIKVKRKPFSLAGDQADNSSAGMLHTNEKIQINQKCVGDVGKVMI